MFYDNWDLLYSVFKRGRELNSDVIKWFFDTDKVSMNQNYLQLCRYGDRTAKWNNDQNKKNCYT